MKNILSIILFLCCVPISYGRFSEFVAVTPNTAEEYKRNISISPSESGLYTIKFPWEKQSKQCWIIVFDDTKSLHDNINFRSVIWHIEKNIPKGISQIIPLRENENGNIEVKIKMEVMRRSYICIDFPSPVSDGGYYYTIDLPSYLKVIEK